MMLIAADGTVEGDTATNKTHPFPYPAMLDRAAEEERFGSVAIMDGRPVWLVVVPVMAPDLIAFVAAALPLDDAELRRIHEVAGVPGRIGIAVQAPQAWKRAAGAIDAAVVANLPGDGEPRAFTGSDGNEALAISRPLATPPGDAAVRVILDYPLSEALRQYQFLSLALLPVLGVGLLATLAGVTLIARGVSRPIELLARQTQRIAAGDYGVQPTLPRRDELGQLSVALGTMTSAIAEREQRILFQATHDSITGLANRTAIAAAIDVRLATGPATLLAVGLIRWREITSTVGRDVGDRLLREAAARIVAYMTGGQGAATVARIGENTFAVLLPGDDPAAASAAALRLIDAFDQPYREAELTIDTPVAVGVASAAAGDTDAAQLPRHAEIALAEAVRTETRFAVYRHDSDPYRPERLSLMGEMRAGLTRGGILARLSTAARPAAGENHRRGSFDPLEPPHARPRRARRFHRSGRRNRQYSTADPLGVAGRTHGGKELAGPRHTNPDFGQRVGSRSNRRKPAGPHRQVVAREETIRPVAGPGNHRKRDHAGARGGDRGLAQVG